MAPEQFRGRHATPASDQYAFALCLWEAVYRRPAFLTRSVYRLMDARDAGEVDDLPGGPRWLRAMLRRCLSPDPNRRFPSMHALAEHIRRHRTRRRQWSAVAVAGAVGVAGMGLLVPVDEDRCAPDPAALADAWGPARQDEVRTALTAAGDELQATATEVLAGLERQAAAWQAAWTTTCNAATETRREPRRADAVSAPAAGRARGSLQRLE